MWYRITLVHGPVAEPIMAVELSDQDEAKAVRRVTDLTRSLLDNDTSFFVQVRKPDGTWRDLTETDADDEASIQRWEAAHQHEVDNEETE